MYKLLTLKTMQDNQRNRFAPDQDGGAHNHQVGRELYMRDLERNQASQDSRGDQSHNDRWDAGNHFHTGYSNQTRSHFPEDSHQRTTNADRGGSLHQHYGNREYSTYRNPNNLNYGQGQPQNQYGSTGSGNTGYSSYGDGRGNYSARQDSYGQGHDQIRSQGRLDAQRRRDDSNENYYRGGYMQDRGVHTEGPLPERNPYNEYPGSRSRYKDDDYRYGSGNHGWYQEQRYTANDGRVMDRDKGGILNEMGEGLREAWQDVTHGVSNLWNRNNPDPDRSSDNRRYQQGNRHDYEYRSRQDRGLERGPRWSDETDSGDDSFFYGGPNKPRYY